ncbi:hypothetical protein BGZ60DRAFT_564337 [Tricladium varicosporioides]|nr:hypothetical protein BGZ60DRAFT_564337 [Hymenoscyphus varicosporioides]
MGTASKVTSACFRVVEFGTSCIILGVLSKFIYVLNQGKGSADSRLIFAISMAAISVLCSLILVAPVKYTFYFFPLDFALFICWITCFALLEDLSGTHTCSSYWYDHYWSFYWGKAWKLPTGTVVVTDLGCSQWRVVLAFSFIISFCWLINGFLSLYVCTEYYNLGSRTVTIVR